MAPLGTAFTEEQAKLVRSFAETVYLSFDSDSAGQNATYKAILLCCRFGYNVHVIEIKGGKDPADILQNEGVDALKKLLDYSILDLDYLISIAEMRFDTGTPEGKSRAANFLFPYLEVLESDIQKESTINRLSAAFGITEKAFISDFLEKRHSSPIKRQTGEAKTEQSVKRKIKRNAEMRVVLACVANMQLFPMMRSCLSADDFEDAVARELFIILEECYRTEATTYDSLLSRCTDETLQNLITETVTNGEFAENAQKVIEDGILLIRRNALERRKVHLINRMNMIHGSDPDKIRTVNEMMQEKRSIDKELSTLKDMNE